MTYTGQIQKTSEFTFELPKVKMKNIPMRTSGIVYADEGMMQHIRSDNALEQVANVATLPGIVGKSMAMPDIHLGYGFPIGGVAATAFDEGVVSPGGVGYDINCGVRLVTTNLAESGVKPKVRDLIDTIFDNVPSGVGLHGKIKLSSSEILEVFDRGAEWAVEKGFGWKEDLEFTEERGTLASADSHTVSQSARVRGAPQLGTLGAGNHFLEVQRVAEVYEPEVAKVFGITGVGQIMVMIHTGSRGAGHQIATDAIRDTIAASKRYGIEVPDKQLAAVPPTSNEGQRYLKQMACGANYAWANRQMILHWVREAFEKVLGNSAESLGMKLVYDVAHNIAKIEEHEVEGMTRKVVVHRKGATRAFGKDHADVPQAYRSAGQPILIPGDMGTASYVLVGTEKAMKDTFGSTCHGSGRLMSREKAIRSFPPGRVKHELAQQGIYVRAASREVLSEEAPLSYKRVDDVVRVCHGAGISRRVAKMVPLGVMKG